MRYGYVSLNRDDGEKEDYFRNIFKDIGCKLVVMDFHGSAKVNLKGLVEGLDKGDEIFAICIEDLADNPTDLAILLHEIDKIGAILTVHEDGFTSDSVVAKELIAIAAKLGMPGLDAAHRSVRDEAVHNFLNSAGRPRALSKDLERQVIDEVVKKGKRQTQIAEMLNVSPSTISRIVKRYRNDSK